MTLDEAYLSRPELAVARHLQRAGRWDLALAHLSALPAPATAAGTTDQPGASDPLRAALTAEIAVDRFLWQLGDHTPALAAIAVLGDTPLATLLTGQLAYWGRLFSLDLPGLDADPVETFAHVLDAPELGGWPIFWHAVATDNLRGDSEAATAGYRKVRQWARDNGDVLLESYASRHLATGDDTVPLFRLSVQQRAAAGARPQLAAAQNTLADALGDTPEAAELRALVAYTAEELGISWLRRDPSENS
ncbi:hypothetical protein R8Z50_07710 [Longispora sp. K20-0274]|uniref:hypothetical protein n=1 Tax=Longispora sp. K20-0274 TaxID=3088255 RepID=UPI00399B20B8